MARKNPDGVGSLWLHLSSNRDGDYAHIIGRVLVQRTPEASRPDDSGLRNPGSYREEHAELSDLEIRCQLDARKPEPYAWEVEYRGVGAVDLERAEGMVKMLRAVGKRMARESEESGSPSTFSEFVVRAARAVGVAGYVVAVRGGTWHHETEYRHMNASDARYWVECEIGKLARALTGQAEQAA